MAEGAKVLRTIYIDPEVDDRLRELAACSDLSKAELFRRYLAAGIKAAKARPSVFAALMPTNSQPLVLRTVYMDPKLDDRLRVQAFDERVSKNDLMRRYVQLGMSLTTVQPTAKARG